MPLFVGLKAIFPETGCEDRSFFRKTNNTLWTSGPERCSITTRTGLDHGRKENDTVVPIPFHDDLLRNGRLVVRMDVRVIRHHPFLER